MTLTKIGLTMHDYVVLGSDLELTQDSSQIRLRNLGKDYASGTADIITFADYSTSTALNFNKNGYLIGYPTGTVSVAGGKLICDDAGYMNYQLPSLNLSKCSFVVRINTKFTGPPGANEHIIENPAFGRMYLRIDSGGALRLFMRDINNVTIAGIVATASSVNDGGTWDPNEEVYIAVCIDKDEGANGTLRLYGGRVSVGTANLLGTDTDIDGVVETSGLTAFVVGGVSTFDGQIGEFVVFDGPISTAASFAIPNEIDIVFASGTAPEVVLNEIDAEGSRTWDMSTWKVNQLLATGTSYEFAYSVSDTSGVHTLSAFMDETDIRNEPDPTGRYMLPAVSLDSDDGVEQATIADTGDFITVGNVAPHIITQTMADAVNGEAYTDAVYADDGDTPYTFAVTAGSLPAGLSLASGGGVTGTPTGFGLSSFTVTVTDSNSKTDPQALSITVNAVTLSITTQTMCDAVRTVAYSDFVYATGGVTPYTFSISAGSLPSGFSLASGGEISGTASSTGLSSFTVKVTDAAAIEDTQALTITVVSLPSVTPPDEPASLAWTDNVDGATGDLDFIIDGDATLTTIEFRREGTTAYSTQTTTDTGAATVTLSGLSVGFYEIRAYSEISGVYSLPSDMIPGQITDTTLAASDNQILVDFGEEILYVPKTGGNRRIWAVVVRDPAEKNSDGTPVKHILIQVDNSDTTGIATDEVNCGFDAVKVDNRRGDTGKEYRIIKPTVQDGDGNMVHYMVR